MRASLPVRGCAAFATLAALALALAGCGGGSGEGLDENGRPIVTGGPAPSGPTLASVQAKVFSVNCAISGCHGGSTVQQGLRLDAGFSAASLINVASPRDPRLIRVVPGNPDASFLIQKLQGTQTLGDRMPLFGPYLPQATIDEVRLWIQNGAPP